MENENRIKEISNNNLDHYISNLENKTLLRFITCGSVDDGKSTLIGRLLFESKQIFEDQLAQLKTESKYSGTQGKAIDFALLVDGLSAEREQGITIDVAYRFFATEKRKFIVADTPGHEQYTRNMVTGASTADLAIILVDATKGILPQTKRHSYIAKLMGIKHFILAINKMDLVDYDKSVFNKIVDEFSVFSDLIDINAFTAIPLSASKGDNVTSLSDNTPWYSGSSLLACLENSEQSYTPQTEIPMRMPVQWVNRSTQYFRGFSGQISSGSVCVGDDVRILPSGKMTAVSRIVTYDGDLEKATAGQPVTLTFTDDIDCSRGDVIVQANQPLEIADQFEARIVWMNDQPMAVGRSYDLKIGSKVLSARISKPKYVENTNNMEKNASKTFELNDIGIATITTNQRIPFESYAESKSLGSFILIDKITNTTAGAGMINFALRRSQNIHWQDTVVTREYHANLKNQKPLVLWMTGFSGSGKSTIANAVEKLLAEMHYHTFILDGDNIRHGLSKDLGFSDADRIENMRRIGEVAKLMTNAGLIVIASFISPFRSEREMVREMMEKDEFVEVFIDAPLEVAEKRDVKGLYAKARAGELKNFTGIDSMYEAPENPDIYIDTTMLSVEQAAQKILERIALRIEAKEL